MTVGPIAFVQSFPFSAPLARRKYSVIFTPQKRDVFYTILYHSDCEYRDPIFRL